MGASPSPNILHVEFTFKGKLWYWRGPSPFHFISIPDKQSKAIKEIASGVTYGWGAIPVVATIGQTEFTTSIFPKDGLYIVPIKNVVRLGEKLEVDDVVKVLLTIKQVTNH